MIAKTAEFSDYSKACDFVTTIGKDNLIAITPSQIGVNSFFGNTSYRTDKLVVWYWEYEYK